MTLLFELIGVAILILLNAFFVAAEYGLVTARRTRIIELQHQGNRRARDVLRITGDPGRFIAAMQLGVTLTSLGIGALGEQTLSNEFDKWMSTVLAVVIAYAILSFFHVVFGELVPKGTALGHAEGTALWVSTPVRAFIAVFRPAIWLLQTASDAILHSFGLEPPGAEREVHSEAELRMLVSRSTQQGAIEEGERELIEKVFVFGDKDVADVMVAKPDVAAVSIDMPPEEALAVVLDSPYTRYPVYRESLDDIVGVLHVRDLFSAIHDRGLTGLKLESLLRPAYVIPETKDLASLLQEFRRTNSHFAVVVDEYGAMVGIATLEDLLEEIVGEIVDEYDVEAPKVERLPDGSVRVAGGTPIDEVNELLEIELPETDWDTVGGLMFNLLGHVPVEGEAVEFQGFEFRAERVQGRRILTVRITPKESEPAESAAT